MVRHHVGLAWRKLLLLVAAALCTFTFTLARAPSASATAANFCDYTWTAYDTRCWWWDGYNAINEYGRFLRGYNGDYTADMWVQFISTLALSWSAHAGTGSYKACLDFNNGGHGADYYGMWDIMPFPTVPSTIGGWLDNYRSQHNC
jgi:hypothetical protein